MPLIRSMLSVVAAYAAAALAVRLVDEACDAWEASQDTCSQARRRVELLERAEVIEAELEGIHLVREAPAPDDQAEPVGVFGPVPHGEA